MCLKYIEQNLRFLKWWEWHMEGHVSKHLPCCQRFNICTSGWEKDWCPSCWGLYKIWPPCLPTWWEPRAFWNVSSLSPPLFLLLFLVPLLAFGLLCRLLSSSSCCSAAVSQCRSAARMTNPLLIPGFWCDSPSRVSLFCLVIFIICSVPREILISEYHAFHSDCLAAISLWS